MGKKSTPDYSRYYEMQAKAIEEAARIQRGSADEALDFQQKMYDENKRLNKPFRQNQLWAINELKRSASTGTVEMANNLTAELDAMPVDSFEEWRNKAGLTKDLATVERDGVRSAFDQVNNWMQKVETQGLRGDPSYDFRLREGQRALARRQAAGGYRMSGQAAREAVEYGQEFASQEYDKEFNRQMQLGGLAEASDEARYARLLGEYGLNQEHQMGERGRHIESFSLGQAARGEQENKLRVLAGLGAHERQLSMNQRFGDMEAETALGKGDTMARSLVDSATARSQGRIKEAESRHARTGAIWSSLGSIAGAFAGGPGGAAIGKKIGQSIGGDT